jgi:hypothetical protein
VGSPFTVTMEADGFTIEQAGQVREGAGHLHLMVDADCVSPGEQIPEDEAHLHFGDGATETQLELPAGEHTLCLQAGDGNHTALDLTDEITIMVAGPGAMAGEEQEWEGSIHLQYDQQLASGDMCQATGDARGKLLVAADDRISGTLDAEETENCTFGFDRTRSGLTLVLEGTASASALTVNHTTGTTTGYFIFGFFSAPGVLDPVPIPITAPRVAAGSVTREFPGVNPTTVTLTFDFRCETC